MQRLPRRLPYRHQGPGPCTWEGKRVFKKTALCLTVVLGMASSPIFDDEYSSRHRVAAKRKILVEMTDSPPSQFPYSTHRAGPAFVKSAQDLVSPTMRRTDQDKPTVD